MASSLQKCLDEIIDLSPYEKEQIKKFARYWRDDGVTGPEASKKAVLDAINEFVTKERKGVLDQIRSANSELANSILPSKEIKKPEITPQRRAEILWNEVKDAPKAQQRARQAYIKETLGIDIGPKFEAEKPDLKPTPEKKAEPIKVQRSSEEAGDLTQYEIIDGENKGSSVTRGTLQQNPEQYSIDETLMPAVAKKAEQGASDQLLKDLERLKAKKAAETPKSTPQSTQEETKAVTPGKVRLDKGGVKPFTEYREIKKGRKKGQIEVTLSNGTKQSVFPEQIREYPSQKTEETISQEAITSPDVNKSTQEVVEPPPPEEVKGKEAEFKTYDEAQKAIDDYTDYLVNKYGEDKIFTDLLNYEVSLEIGKEDVSNPIEDSEYDTYSNLYDTRNKIGQRELEQSASEISEVINKETQDNEFTQNILKRIYDIDPTSKTGQYFAAEYTQNQVKKRKDTREKIFNAVKEDYGQKNNLDMDGIFSEMSGFTRKGQRNLLKELTDKAAKIETAVYEYFNPTESKKAAEEGKAVKGSQNFPEFIKSAKDGKEVIDWFIANSKNKSYQAIAERIKPFISDNIDIKIITKGKEYKEGVPSDLSYSKGLYYVRHKDNSKTIYLRDESFNEHGIDEKVALHELIHDATLKSLQEGNKNKNKDTLLGKAVADLYKLQNDIVDYINNNKDILKGYTFDFNLNLESVDELITNGLTDERYQSLLKKIEISRDETAWNKFVKLLGRLFGITNKDQNALARLIETTDTLFEAIDGKEKSKVQEARTRITNKLKDETGTIQWKDSTLRDDLLIIGEDIYNRGHQKLNEFISQLKSILKDSYEKIRNIVRFIWQDIKKRLSSEVGSIDLTKGGKEGLDDLTKNPHGEFTKESKLARRTEADTIEKKLTEDFGDLVEYKTKEGFMKDQAAKAEILLNKDYEKAKRIAMGEEQPAGDLRIASVYEAVKLWALNEGDTDLLYDLATGSKVPTRLSEYGQEIKSADSSIMEDPVKAMQDIEKDRKERNKRQGKKSVSIEKVKDLQKKLADAENKLKEYETKADSENSKKKIDRLIRKSSKRSYRKADSKTLKEKIKKSVDSGREYSNISNDINELAKYFISQGITERNALVREVYNVIKDVIPGITLRETMDAISGYGKFKPLSQDEILVKLRDLKGQMQQVAKLEDMQAGQAPLKTGIERRIPTDEERRLIKQVDQMKKELGIETVDPEKQLKSALDSVKTRLSNQISDLEYQIESGQKIVKKKTGLKYDVEAERLKKRRDELKKQFDNLFGKPEMTEEQRIQIAIKAINKSIEEYTRRISEGDLIPKPKRTPVQSDELNQLRDQRDSLKSKIKELRDLAKPKRSPEEISLQRLKTRLRNETTNLYGKLNKLDIEKTQRRETILDIEGKKLKAERDNIKAAYNAAVEASGIVTREEADRLIELSQEMSKARQDMETGGDRFKYGAAKVAFLRYIDFLKGSHRNIRTLLRDEWEEVKATWKDNRVQAFTKSAKDIISTISDLSISLMASLDNSFLGRQGLNTLLTHPTVWAPAASKSFVDIYKTMVSKHGGQIVRDAVLADAYSRPNYVNGDYETAKLIPKSEEQFPTSIPERIPGLGRAFKASENAFLNSGVRMRINTYDMLKKIAEGQGVNTNDKVWVQDIGKLINSLTARGDLGKMGSGGPLRLIFWAPKMLWGNINVLTAHFGGDGLKTRFARNQARKNLLKIVGLTVLVAAIIDGIGRMFGKKDVVEWDPRSSDFMKVKINNTRYDLTAGKGSIITLLARAATFKTKSTKTKKVTDLNSGKYGAATLFDVIVNFIANKSAPVTKTAIDVARGRNFNYEKPTIGNTTYNLATPIGIQNFIESYQRSKGDIKDIPSEEIIGNFLDMIGINANTYDTEAVMKRKYKALQKKEKRQKMNIIFPKKKTNTNELLIY